MPSTEELRKRLRQAKVRHRQAEEALLEERRKEQELDRAYREVQAVRPETMPNRG